MRVETLSASQVSEINEGLDEQVQAFRTRALAEEYPVPWVDAIYEKIRDNGKVISAAVLVYEVNLEGKREILAVEPMYEESAASRCRGIRESEGPWLEKGLAGDLRCPSGDPGGQKALPGYQLAAV